jgi:transcriptional regulator with PAS, ATPase and Fis domain
MNYKELKNLQEKLGIIGQSDDILELIEMIHTVAPADISVLINGESGSGKEVIANSIHKLSNRKHKPFVAINCGALPDGLIDSELFGHEKGSFTGAVAQKKGLFEAADEGTIFLDEIGEMPLKTQVRLLRVLENGEVIRVGGTESIRVNVRIIAATHRNLLDLINENDFRKDLYYRLKAVTITVPPLRDRKQDIPLLIDHFIRQYIISNHVIYGGIEEDAKSALVNYSWPGNIRELKNVLETLLVLCKGNAMTRHHVMQQLPEIEKSNHSFFQNENKSLPVYLNKSSDQAERELIYQTLLSLRMDITDIKAMLAQFMNPITRPSLPASTFQHEKMNENPNAYELRNEEKHIENFSMDEMEKEMIHKALERFDGNRRKAATALNISERTLYRKIREYDLQ